jgi:hypothetical protein
MVLARGVSIEPPQMFTRGIAAFAARFRFGT